MESVTYRIHHTTTYNYSTPVRVCHNLVMLTPRGDGHAEILTHRLNIRPTPPILSKRTDYFGNLVHAFSIEESHRQLVVNATARVRVESRDCPEISTPWNFVRQQIVSQIDPHWLDACRFAFNSPRIQMAPQFAEYSSVSFTPQRSILEAARDLTSRIHRDFKYDSLSTNVNTSTDRVFAQRSGVCQDFSHVQIACLRSIGLCARYVSGYLRTNPPPGKERLIGADQSHAWVSLYCGPELGWIDLDPTNDCLAGVSHIPIAWGRDYTDVTPFRGVFLGGGDHRLEVSVDVCPV
jgi:transglutaminase-like putative cysteine protease